MTNEIPRSIINPSTAIRLSRSDLCYLRPRAADSRCVRNPDRLASAEHNITILYSLTIGSQPTVLLNESRPPPSFPLPRLENPFVFLRAVPIYYESFSRDRVPNAPSFDIHKAMGPPNRSPLNTDGDMKHPRCRSTEPLRVNYREV